MKFVFIVLAATCISPPGTLAQPAKIAPSTQPDQSKLPPIKAGETRLISVEELSEEAKRYYIDQHEKIQASTKNVGTLSFREIPAPVEEVESLKHFVARAAKQEPSPEKLGVRLATIEPPSPLSGAPSLGSYAESPTGGPIPTRATRIYRLGSKVVMLTEWDFVASGGGVVQMREYVNASVDGRPAVLTAKRSRDGKALWTMTWTTERKDYALYLYEDTFDEATAALANKIASTLVE